MASRTCYLQPPFFVTSAQPVGNSPCGTAFAIPGNWRKALAWATNGSNRPVVLPERIDAEFLAVWNSPRRLQRVVVIHANHAQELRGAVDVRAALGALRAAGTTLLNQSVPQLVREVAGATSKTMLPPASR